MVTRILFSLFRQHLYWQVMHSAFRESVSSLVSFLEWRRKMKQGSLTTALVYCLCPMIFVLSNMSRPGPKAMHLRFWKNKRNIIVKGCPYFTALPVSPIGETSMNLQILHSKTYFQKWQPTTGEIFITQCENSEKWNTKYIYTYIINYKYSRKQFFISDSPPLEIEEMKMLDTIG